MPELPVVSSFKFRDFDFFAYEIEQGDIVHKQLSSGHFSGSLSQLAGEHIILSIHRMNQFILQQGTTLEGYITFFIPGDANQDFTWRCNQLRGDVIGVLQGGMEHYCITHPNFVGMPVSIKSEYLIHLAQDLGYYEFLDSITKRECFVIDREKSEEIRLEIGRIFQNPSFFSKSWQEYMAATLIRTIQLDQETGRNTVFRTGHSRRRICQKAIHFMQERIMEPASIRDLTEAVGVSERNLRYAFHEVAKMSPKRFFDRMRLNQVRKLLRSGNFQSVIDVSQTYGYWHSGKFASDYKSLFYEYPSESLNRNP